MNLIMDILAAIALGTEPISKNERVPVANKETRISRAAKIFMPVMWRQIVVQSAYQLIVLLSLLYFGTFIFFDKPYNLVTTPSRKDSTPTDKMTMDTIIFNTFFMMNMFNQINCRVLDETEINVFKTLCNNLIFWVVFAVEMLLQHLMLYLATTTMGSAILGMTPITLVQYSVSVALGAFSLVVCVITKKSIPMSPFEKLSRSVDLETGDTNDRVSSMYETAKNKMAAKGQAYLDEADDDD